MNRRNILILISLLIILLILPKQLKNLGAKPETDPNDEPGISDEDPDNGLGDDEEPQDEFPLIKYTTSSLRLRKGPSTEDEIILTMPELAEVEVLESLDGWDKLTYDGETGYASSDYLSLEKIERADPNPDPDPVIGLKIINGVLLVNKKYGIPANHFKGEDPEAREHLDKMMADIKNEIGLGLTLRSGHRTYELQEKFFNNNARVNGLEHASKYSARPGHSEHETGLTFDLCDIPGTHCLKESFENTKEGIWLRENAHKYGFILRYPKGKEKITGYAYEPWHFRYVGKDHAEIIYERDITLEEYLLPDEY